MNRPRVTVYLALLLVLSLSAGAVLSVGQTQARAVGAVTLRNTVVLAKPGTVRSNCLIGDGKQIILLGDLESGASVTAEFTLETTEALDGQMIWFTTEGAPVTVEVDFVMDEGEGTLEEDHTLTMEANAKATVSLTITAGEEITEAWTVDVQMICQHLLGIFRVELIPDPGEPEPSEPEETDPTESTEPTESEETEPTEAAEPTYSVQTEETQPTDPTESEETDPTDPPEPEETDPTDPTESEESTESPQTEEALPQAEVTLMTLGEFEITKRLPLKLGLSGDADRLLLGLEAGEPLPPFTRYSTDGGQNWYLLYFGGYVEITEGFTEEGASWSLLADFSAAGLIREEPMDLELQAFLGEIPTGTASVQTVPRAEQVRSETVQILTTPTGEAEAQIALLLVQETEPAETEETEPEPIAQTQPEETDPAETTEATDPSEETQPETEGQTQPTEETDPTEATEPAEATEPTESPETTAPTESTEPETEQDSPLEEGGFFTVALPIGWAECDEILFRAEILAMNADGTAQYVQVDWDPERLDAVVDEATGTLIVYMGAMPPAAGTYRLTVECIFEGICFEQMQMTFFINYSTRSDAQNEEVPNND